MCACLYVYKYSAALLEFDICKHVWIHVLKHEYMNANKNTWIHIHINVTYKIYQHECMNACANMNTISHRNFIDKKLSLKVASDKNNSIKFLCWNNNYILKIFLTIK